MAMNREMMELSIANTLYIALFASIIKIFQFVY